MCHLNLEKLSLMTPFYSNKDRDMIIKEIKDKAMVFNKYEAGQFHKAFPNFTCNPIRTLNHKEICDWLIKIGKTKGITIKF